jgi:hypothetical protein
MWSPRWRATVRELSGRGLKHAKWVHRTHALASLRSENSETESAAQMTHFKHITAPASLRSDRDRLGVGMSDRDQIGITDHLHRNHHWERDVIISSGPAVNPKCRNSSCRMQALGIWSLDISALSDKRSA